MINEDAEKILIGTWLLFEHLEDMNKFEPYQFQNYPQLFWNIKEGERDYVELVKKSGVSAKEINDLMHYGSYDAMYEVAILNIQKDLADEWLERHPDAKPAEIKENMDRFMQTAEKLPKPTEDPIEELIEDLDRVAQEKPVSTGLVDLDRMLNGIRTKELTVVGARPSVGKSAFVQQVAMKVAEQGKKVLFFPLEMSELALNKRMLMRHVKIPQYEIRNGLSRETWERSNEAINRMNEFIDSGNWLVYERCNDLRIIKGLIERHKPYMIVIDQLEQLRDGDMRFDGKRERFSHMTHELQAISLDMDVAVWMACQVNRDANNSPPTMANLKESGTIEEDATNVILLHREGDKTDEQYIQLDLAKQKDGACGKVDLLFKAPIFTFYGVGKE